MVSALLATHCKAMTTLYRAHLKPFEVTVKAAKYCYFFVSTASVGSHPAQLSRVIRQLVNPLVASKVDENIVMFFSDKLSLLHQDLGIRFGVRNLGALRAQLGTFLEYFNSLSQVDAAGSYCVCSLLAAPWIPALPGWQKVSKEKIEETWETL